MQTSNALVLIPFYSGLGYYWVGCFQPGVGATVLIPFYSGLGYYGGNDETSAITRSLNPFLFRAWLLRFALVLKVKKWSVLIPFYSGLGYYKVLLGCALLAIGLNPFLFRAWLLQIQTNILPLWRES